MSIARDDGRTMPAGPGYPVRVAVSVVVSALVVFSSCQARIAHEPGPEPIGSGLEPAAGDRAAAVQVEEDQAAEAPDPAHGGAEAAGPIDTSGYRIVDHPDGDGVHAEVQLVDALGVPVPLPGDTAEQVRWSRPVLFGGGRYLMHEVEDAEQPGRSGLAVLDLHRGQRVLLDHLEGLGPEEADGEGADLEFLDYGMVSPDGRHVLAIAGGVAGEPGVWGRIRVYTIDDGALVAVRDSAVIRPHVRCHARCSAELVGFTDNETVHYLEQAGVPDPSEDERVVVEIRLDGMSAVGEGLR